MKSNQHVTTTTAYYCLIVYACVYNVWNYENVNTLFNELQIIIYFNFIKVSSDDLENKMAFVVAAGVST